MPYPWSTYPYFGMGQMPTWPATSFCSGYGAASQACLPPAAAPYNQVPRAPMIGSQHPAQVGPGAAPTPRFEFAAPSQLASSSTASAIASPSVSMSHQQRAPLPEATFQPSKPFNGPLVSPFYPGTMNFSNFPMFGPPLQPFTSSVSSMGMPMPPSCFVNAISTAPCQTGQPELLRQTPAARDPAHDLEMLRSASLLLAASTANSLSVCM